MRLIPPFLVLIIVIAMTIVALMWPVALFLDFPYNLIGILPMILGIVMLVTSQKLFKKKKAEIDTFKTPKALVTEQWFRMSRNPIYLAMLLFLTGFFVVLAQLALVIFPIIFFLIANFWYIRVEERNMTEEFGDDYRAYRKKVRRWL